MEKVRTPEAKKELRRRLSILTAFGSIFVLIATLPAWTGQLLATSIAVGALVLAIRHSTPVMVISIILICLGALTTMGTLLLSSEINRFTNCQIGANTHVANEECTLNFKKDLERRLSP